MNKQTFAEDDFLITDPEKHPGVVLEVPAGVQPLRLEPVGYRAGKEVRCAFCPQRQRHRRGFFAVLPDETVALCGNCCAEKIAGKSTVAKIQRDVKRREEVAAARKDIALLAAGLAPVIEILERDWLPVETEIHRHVHRLHECFYSSKPPRMAKLSVAWSGLRDITSAASQGLADLAATKKRRVRALEMVEEGLSELRGEREKLAVHSVQQLVARDEPVHGYRRTMLDRRSLYLLNTHFWADPEISDCSMEHHMTLPKIDLPDADPLIEAVGVAKLVEV